MDNSELTFGIIVIVMIVVIVVGVRLLVGLIGEMLSAASGQVTKVVQWRQEKRRGRLEKDRQVDETRKQEVAQLERRRQQQEPRRLAQRFYAANLDQLIGRYPPPLFEAFLRLEMHEGLEPPAIWRALEKWIKEMQAILAEDRGAARERARQIQDLDRQIAEWRRKIENLARNGADPDTVREETGALEALIRGLERQKELLSHPAGGQS